MEDLASCYKILGISPDASLQEANQAYTKLLTAIRIDCRSADPELRRKAETMAEAVNGAYAEIQKVLSVYHEPETPAERAKEEKAAAGKTDAAVRTSTRRAVSLLVLAVAAAAAFFVQKVVMPARNDRTKAVREEAGTPPTGVQQALTRGSPAQERPKQAPAPDASKTDLGGNTPDAGASQEAEREAQRAVATWQARDHAVHHAEMVRLAAERGDSEAENRLGTLYAAGIGLPQDYAEAAKWYRKAAEHGHATAQKNLADLLVLGKGTAKNLDEAIKWYRRAARQGDREAQRALDRLSAQ